MTNSLWHTLFWNSDGQRLRPLWRLCIQLAIMFGLLGFLVVAFAFVNVFTHWHISDIGMFGISTLIELIAFTASVAIARRWLDKKPFLDLGLHANWSGKNTFIDELFWGFLLAAVLMAFVYFTMIRFGWIQFIGYILGDQPLSISMFYPVLLYLGIFVVVGFQEELLCRGYHLRTIASGWNVFFGVIGSSVIFAALHLGNPGANWMGFIGIFCAGMLLAFAAVRTGRLWLSIGIHIGWNFFEGVVFGFPTSGVAIYSLLRIHVTGPVLWTGGAFGPEAGLIILPALVIGAGLVYLYTK